MEDIETQYYNVPLNAGGAHPVASRRCFKMSVAFVGIPSLVLLFLMASSTFTPVIYSSSEDLSANLVGLTKPGIQKRNAMVRAVRQPMRNPVQDAHAGLLGLGGRVGPCRYIRSTAESGTGEALASFSKSEFRSFPVQEVRDAGPGTKILKCELPSSQHRMGMDVSSMVMVNGEKGADGTAPARPYTPISTDEQRGYFELLVKGYPTGVVSKFLVERKPGDLIEVKGPFPKLAYTANMKKEIGMLAGGSGITPMLQVIKEILKDPADSTKVTLIFCNQSPADILLRKELDQLAASSKGQLKMVYVVDKNEAEDPDIKHVGYLTQDFLATVLPKPSMETLIYVCGPPPMLKSLAGDKLFEEGKPPAQGELKGILKDLDYTADMVFKF